MNNWDKKFIGLVRHIAQWSKDKSTQTAAVIVDNDHRILSTGYNGFPVGVNDSIEERYERPAKYLWTEHAERNAIYSAAKNGIPLNGSTMYMDWFPCADCARAIIQAGIRVLICKEPDWDNGTWGESWKVAFQMLYESKVVIVYHAIEPVEIPIVES